jgi:hypothetical protein
MQNICYKFNTNLIYKKCIYHLNVYQGQKDGNECDYEKAASFNILQN